MFDISSVHIRTLMHVVDSQGVPYHVQYQVTES